MSECVFIDEHFLVAFGYRKLDWISKVAKSYSMRELKYTKSAIRSLRKMPANTATLIISKIEAYAKEPETQNNNVKMLKGRQGFRLRVGSWRVIMDDDGNVLAVLDIGHRSSIYE